MSGLLKPLGGMLDVLVEARRGMTETEATRFLATGELPDLSRDPVDEVVGDMGPVVLDAYEVRRLLMSSSLVAAGGFSSPGTLHHTSPHQAAMRVLTRALRFDPHQPRDDEGKWTDDSDDGDGDDLLDEDDFLDEDEDDEGSDVVENVDTLFVGDTTWSDRQRRAANVYTDRYYEDINAYLRGGETGELDADTRGVIDDVRSMMRPTTRDVVTYRGVNLSALGPDVTHDNLVERLGGRVLEDGGFVSTSLSRNIVNTYYPAAVLFEVEVPRGSRALYVGQMTANETNDYELVLADGSKMRVLNVRRANEHQTVVRVRVEP